MKKGVYNCIPFYLIMKCDIIDSMSKGGNYGRKDISE